jgi:RNA polymerase sigma factor (sigma-70 family)
MAHASLSYILERSETSALLAAEDELALGRIVQEGLLAKRRLDSKETTNRRADKRAFEEGRKARDEMVVRNVRLAQNVARRYRLRSGGDPEDLFMYGVLGLFRAAELFDPTKGLRFSTYAVLWIRQAINAAIGDLAHSVHVPYPQQLKEIRLRALVTEEGSTINGAATELGMMPQTAVQLLAACASSSSFDQPIGFDDGGRTLGDVVPTRDRDGFVGVDNDVMADDLDASLTRSFEFLDQREREVMRCFLEASDDEPPTLEEVAASTGMPSTLVRSKRLSARSKLGHPAADLRQRLGR